MLCGHDDRLPCFVTCRPPGPVSCDTHPSKRPLLPFFQRSFRVSFAAASILRLYVSAVLLTTLAGSKKRLILLLTYSLLFRYSLLPVSLHFSSLNPFRFGSANVELHLLPTKSFFEEILKILFMFFEWSEPIFYQLLKSYFKRVAKLFSFTIPSK